MSKSRSQASSFVHQVPSCLLKRTPSTELPLDLRRASDLHHSVLSLSAHRIRRSSGFLLEVRKLLTRSGICTCEATNSGTPGGDTSIGEVEGFKFRAPYSLLPLEARLEASARRSRHDLVRESISAINHRRLPPLGQRPRAQVLGTSNSTLNDNIFVFIQAKS